MSIDRFISYLSVYFIWDIHFQGKKNSLKQSYQNCARILHVWEDSKKTSLWTEANELSMGPSSDFLRLLKKMNIFREINAITISLSVNKWH